MEERYAGAGGCGWQSKPMGSERESVKVKVCFTIPVKIGSNDRYMFNPGHSGINKWPSSNWIVLLGCY